MSEQQLRAAAAAAGVDTDPILFPYQIAQDVLVGAKRLARYLRKGFPAIGQRQALEHIGKALRLDGWHHLEATASHVIESGSPGEKGGHLYAIRHAFPLTHLAREVVWCYQPEVITGIATLADRIGVQLGAPVAQVRDCFAQAMGSETWTSLVERRPETQPGPFYSFHLTDDGRGEIRESMACAELRRSLREGWGAYGMANEADQHNLRSRLWRILNERPDFLIGWAALIEMNTDDGDTERAEQLLREQIARIEALIPKGFKGRFSRESLGNCTYESALYNYMIALGNRGAFREAIKVARKLKRIDERDSYGINETLALLYSLTGEHAKAAPLIARLEARRYDLNAETALLLAHSYFLQQKHAEGIAWFLVALYRLPMIRPLIEGKRYQHDDPKLVRVSIPDNDEMFVRLGWVERNIPAAMEISKAVLADKDIQASERDMENRWFAARKSNDPFAIEQWFRSVPLEAESLARKLAAPYLETPGSST